MRKIGLIGGLGPESTKLYYSELENKFLKKSKGQYPEIIIYSVNMSECKAFQEKDDLNSLANLLSHAVDSLVKAGADFVSIASNTPHIVFDQVSSKANVPMISIVEESARYAESTNKKIGLLGTGFTMKADFYPACFRQHGLETFVPENNDQDFMHEKIFSELARGIVNDSTKKRFISIAEALIEKDGIDSLMLACTELPLIFNKEHPAVKYINTAEIHVNSILDYCFQES